VPPWRTTISVVLAAACCATAAPAGAATHDWLRFGFDGRRSNDARVVAGIGAGDLAGLEAQDVTLPGTVDSSPLYVHAVRVLGKTRDVFLAETTYGRAVALSARTGRLLWTYTPPSYESVAGTRQYTAASPVADRKHGFVYIATPDGHVRKLRIADGSEVVTDSWPASISLDGSREKISSPLNLSKHHVIATTAGYGDVVPPFQGHVAFVERGTGRLDNVFNSLCSKQHVLLTDDTCPETASGIWARSGAVIVPGTHRILVATGNAAWNGRTYWGDSVLSLAPDGSRLLGNWTPRNQEAMETFDVDLGSTAPALLRYGKRWLGFQSGKDGDLRLLNVDDLNGHGRPCACKGGELWKLHTPHDVGVYSTPATWRHRGRSWLFVTTYDDTTAYRVTGKEPHLERVWRRDRAGTSPVIAGGLLYVYDPTGGGLSVYRPATGKRLANLPAEPGHWNSPIVADGRIALPTGSAKRALLTGTLKIFRRPAP
jgi:outer membrane protein assembly factor BamB